MSDPCIEMINTTHASMPTLLIVDDHAAFRSFARTMFATEGFDVTGEAPDGETALNAVREQHPDVVLLDVQLPGMDGFDVARRLAQGPFPPRIVLTSTREQSDYGSLIEGAPVQGFLPKRALSGETLLHSIAA
jgi:CheY-like chemotaxis protein